MGKPIKIYEDKILPDIADRAHNRIKVYEKDNGEVVINYRNFKIMLFKEEIPEWRDGFREALKNLEEGGYFKNDI